MKRKYGSQSTNVQISEASVHQKPHKYCHLEIRPQNISALVKKKTKKTKTK